MTLFNSVKKHTVALGGALLGACILLGLLLLYNSSQSSAGELKPFTSDGCSLFPDKSLITEQEWCSCCFEHDIQYWQGGTEEERLQADTALKQCVLENTGNEDLAELMYQGVRFGGSPYFYNWYRWGYGWNYDRKYQELTSKEHRQVEKHLEEYFKTVSAYPCKDE